MASTHEKDAMAVVRSIVEVARVRTIIGLLIFGATGMGLLACSTVPDRAAPSSYGCMAAVRDKLPADIPDKRAHCLAAGGIALRCSVGEADMAGIGKELGDVFTGGDPSWADWKADRVGIRCVKAGATAETLPDCCQAAGD
jgi:hypothetical protein